MINTRGRVITVHLWEVDVERDKGSKVINNPKETYYPQYDKSLSLESDVDPSPPNQVEDDDYLEAEEV